MAQVKKLLCQESDLLDVGLVVQKARKQGTVMLLWGLIEFYSKLGLNVFMLMCPVTSTQSFLGMGVLCREARLASGPTCTSYHAHLVSHNFYSL